MKTICPTCQESFAGEEYCPVHFLKLALPASQPTPGPSQDEAMQPTTPEAAALLLQPDQPDQADQPASADNSASLLDRIKKKLGGRFQKMTAVPADSPALGPPARPSADQAPETIELPPEVRDRGWTVDGPPVTLHGVDMWPVQRTDTEHPLPGRLVVYPSGVLTDVATYERLSGLLPSPCRAQLHAHGTVDRGHKLRAACELITTPGEVQMLDHWLAASQASEERGLSLLPGLRALVDDWLQSRVAPICLDPTVLQRDAAGGLRLVRFGAMMTLTPGGAAAAYRPELARSGLLPAPWVAPEVKGRLVVSPHSAVFSIGQILAMAVFGEAPSLHDVQCGRVTFHAIQSPVLARLLMGCLWPQAEERWNFQQLHQGLAALGINDLPEVPAWSRLVPGAAQNAFNLGGESFYRLEDAVQQANQPRHWAEALQRLDALLLWATGTAWKGVAEGLRVELSTSTRSPDWCLVRLTRQVRPDLPLTWRGLDLSDTHAQASLTALAQAALTSATPDFTPLRQLINADLRGAFTASN